jgi:hypothetical protein
VLAAVNEEWVVFAVEFIGRVARIEMDALRVETCRQHNRESICDRRTVRR